MKPVEQQRINSYVRPELTAVRPETAPALSVSVTRLSCLAIRVLYRPPARVRLRLLRRTKKAHCDCHRVEDERAMIEAFHITTSIRKTKASPLS